MNQCDGCRAHIPIIHGMHRMQADPDSKYNDYMTCQAVRYDGSLFGDDEYYEVIEGSMDDWKFDDAGNLVYTGGEPPDGNGT